MRVDLVLVVKDACFQQDLTFVGQIFQLNAVEAPTEFHHGIGPVPFDGVGLKAVVVEPGLDFLYGDHAAAGLVTAAPQFAVVFVCFRFHEFLQQILEFLLGNLQARCVQAFVDAGEIEEIGDIVAAVVVGHKSPEGMSGQFRLTEGELVESAVSAGEEGRLQFVVQCGVPGFGCVCDVSVRQPFWQVEECLVAGEFAQIVTEQQVVDQHPGQPLTYLTAEIGVVAVVVHQHLVVHQFCDPAGVLPVDLHANIRLLHVIETVVDDDVCPTLEAVFHEVFELRQFLFRYLCNDLAQVQATLTEIGIEIPRLIISPVEFLILHAILPKGDGVHLRKGGQPCQQGKHGGCNDFSCHTQVQHTLLDCRSTPNVGKY